MGGADVSDLAIGVESPDQPEIRALLAARDVEMNALYVKGLVPIYVLSVEALAKPNVLFCVARRDGEAVGTAAMLLDAGGWAEMKSIYVAPQARGQGIAEKLVALLEDTARAEGVPLIRLETGLRQTEAIRLYEKRGYGRIGPFGHYPDHPMSVFMEKWLA